MGKNFTDEGPMRIAVLPRSFVFCLWQRRAPTRVPQARPFPRIREMEYASMTDRARPKRFNAPIWSTRVRMARRTSTSIVTRRTIIVVPKLSRTRSRNHVYGEGTHRSVVKTVAGLWRSTKALPATSRVRRSTPPLKNGKTSSANPASQAARRCAATSMADT